MSRWFLFLVLVAVVCRPARAELRVVAVTGQVPPGLMNVTISSVGNPSINEAGYTAFQGTTSGSTLTNNYLWSEGNGGGLVTVGHEGNAAPGNPAGGVAFDDFIAVGDPILSDNGQLVFRSLLKSFNVTTANDNGLYRGKTLNLLEQVAREGSAAPGFAAGVNFSTFGVPKLNSSGRVMFTGSLIGSGITTANDTVIWTDAPGSGLVAIAQEGTQAAGLSAGLNYGSFSSTNFNDNGRVAFSGTVVGSGITSQNDSAIWRTTVGTNVDLFAREGNQAPGVPGGDVFLSLGSPVVNNAGHVAFASNLAGADITSANTYGIWSDRSGQLALDYRAGDPIPGMESSTFGMLAVPAMNHQSRMAFLAVVVGGTTTTGIFNEGRTGSLELVALGSAQAPGTPDGVIFSSFTQSIQPAMNARGQVAFFGKVAGTGITTANDVGIWATDVGGTLHLVAREGDTIDVDPGVGTDFRTIDVLSFYTGSGNEDGKASAFNDSGQLAFLATFVGGGGGVFVSDAVTGLPGDYNGNGVVDAGDYVLWRKGGTLKNEVRNPGTVSQEDYVEWRARFDQGGSFGLSVLPFAVPEPNAISMIVFGFAALLVRRK